MELKEEIRRLRNDNEMSVNDICKQLNCAPSTVWMYLHFDSRKEYLAHLREKKNLKEGYLENMVHNQGFENLTDYTNDLDAIKQKNPNYILFGDFLSEQLQEKELSPNTLAKISNLTRQSISRYLNRKTLPNKESYSRIAKALDLPYLTIDSLIHHLLTKK